MIVKKIIGFLVFTLMVMVSLGLATAFAQAPNFRINFNVPIRGDISVDMGAVVVVNPNKVNNGSTVLVLNGTGQTSITFQPFADKTFTDKIGKKISRFVLLNYPGHANSSLPISKSGANFGSLTLSDYVTALIESIKVLDNIGIAPDFIMGHSLGAEMLHLAQDRLITQGTSFRKQFGVKGAFFVVPDIVGPVPWGFADSGTGTAVVQMLTVNDPLEGTVVRFPPPVWLAFFYGDLAGKIASQAPTPADAAQRFITDDSRLMAAEFVGALGSRPLVTEGIFADSQGTISGLVGLEQDGIYTQAEHKALYTYLTKDKAATMFFFLTGPTTVHNQHVFEPSALLEPFRKVFAKANKK